jgi:hypothetical protein
VCLHTFPAQWNHGVQSWCIHKPRWNTDLLRNPCQKKSSTILLD